MPRRSWKPETQGRSTQHSGVRGGTEGLKGNSGGRAEKLAVIGRGGGRGRLARISGDRGDLELGGPTKDTWRLGARRHTFIQTSYLNFLFRFEKVMVTL